MLVDPNDWETLARRFSSGVVMRIGFGVKIEGKDDPYIQMAVDADHATGNGGIPAGTIVDLFPLIRHFPNWLARSAPLKHARDSKFAIQRLHNEPWAATEPELKAGQANGPSFMRTHYERFFNNVAEGKPNEMSLTDVRFSLSISYT